MVKKLALLALLACVCVLPAYSQSILAVSNDLTTNNATLVSQPATFACASAKCPTIDLSLPPWSSTNPAWYDLPITGADWISINDTGNPSSGTFYTEPNGTSVTFTTPAFDIPTGAQIWVYVLADDTTNVSVNGITDNVKSASGGPFPTCSYPNPIGCLSTTEGVYNITTGFGLTPTDNTITFDTIQGNLSSYGLQYAIVATPEPGTFLLLGSALIGLAGLLRRKMIARLVT